MEAVVEEALGDIEGGHPQVPLGGRAREDELVEGGALECQRQELAGPAVAKLCEEVVGVQHGGLRGLLQSVAAEAADVGVGADENAEVALEAAQAPDRLLGIVAQLEPRLGGGAVGASLQALDSRHRQEGLDPVGDRDWPRSRPAAAVRLRERLVEVEMDDVEPHVARARTAHDRVEVGAVVVERAPHPVHDRGDLGDVAVEQAEGVGVGQHQRGDVLVGLLAQVVDVHPAVRRRGDLHDLKAGHRHRGGICPVRRVRGQDLCALLAAVRVVRAGEQQAGELPVRTGGRLEADVRQSGELAELTFQVPHQLERSLCPLRVLSGVQAGVAGEGGDALVDSRVVLHRARAERVRPGVEVEVAARDAVVVADDLRLGDLRQLGGLRSEQALRDQLGKRRFGNVGRREDGGAATFN